MITHQEATQALAAGDFKKASALKEALETIAHLYQRIEDLEHKLSVLTDSVKP